MRLLTALLTALFLTAHADAIPGVTIPFPDQADDSETPQDTDVTDEDSEDTESMVLEMDSAAVQQGPIATPDINAGPHLASADYPVRAYGEDSVIRLVWSIRREAMDGSDEGGVSERVLTLGPDFAQDLGGDAPILLDLAEDRRLTLDLDTRTMRNESFYGDIRQRLDTYLGLSQGGTLTDIPFGPDRTFERFWLEAAMGMRRQPASLVTETADGMMRVRRAGVTIFAFATPEAAAAAQEAARDVVLDLEPELPGESPDADADAGADPLLDLLRGDETGSGPDAPADAAQSADGGSENADTEAGPAPPAATQSALEAHMPVFRRWMRHALPLHPDAFSAMDGLSVIPEQFELMVISPASPEGRREVWTLERVETAPASFPLPDDLAPVFAGREIVADRAVPAFRRALAETDTDHAAAIIAEAEAYLEAGNLPAAYLAAYQESAHSTACSPQTTDRPSCALASRIVSAGLGNAEFERFFDGIAAIASGRHEAAYGGVRPYLDLGGYAGAAANIIAANEVIAWTVGGGEPPEDADPFAMLATALENDPAAPAAYWHMGQTLLSAGDRSGGWAVFDLGRVINGSPLHPLLAQSYILENRLRALAPDFFLPR